MTGYTSGKHHDPLPHIDAHGRRFEEAYTAPYRDCRQCTTTYDPRPEYDNHNPILEDLRENGDIAGHLEFCAEIHPAGHYSTPLGKAHITHARRVLTKLAALTTDKE